MGFLDNIPDVHVRAISQIGAPAVYTPLIGDTVDCHVIVKHDSELRPESLDIGVVEVGTTIKCLYSTIGEPDHGSTFTVDGAVYRVARIDSNNRIFVKVVVNELV